MKEKYKIIVDMNESHDIEGQHYWEITNPSGYAVKRGVSRTPLIAFAEAMEAYEEIKSQK